MGILERIAAIGANTDARFTLKIIILRFLYFSFCILALDFVLCVRMHVRVRRGRNGSDAEEQSDLIPFRSSESAHCQAAFRVD